MIWKWKWNTKNCRIASNKYPKSAAGMGMRGAHMQHVRTQDLVGGLPTEQQTLALVQKNKEFIFEIQV